MLRALRAGALSPGASGVRVLWMTTSRETSTAVLRAFEAGADDVTRSPMAYTELLARVRALLRRSHWMWGGDAPAVIVCGVLEIDMAARVVTFGGVPVELRRMEFALLARLALDPTRVQEKHALLAEVWGFRSTGATRTLVQPPLAPAGARGGAQDALGVRCRERFATRTER